MVIFDGDLDDAAVQDSLKRVQGDVGAAGTIATTDFWGRRRFAYEIDHKNEGYYAVLEILADGGALDPAERSLRLADDVVRHKLIRLPDHEAARRELLVDGEAVQAG
jgi:small subunit ribosomal protein S6